ncbi:MAG: toprim domain-containing protein [Thaumarchaeota archaeon]|nr:toprim domain-containing protein [Nitrososphaerota archaeon]
MVRRESQATVEAVRSFVKKLNDECSNGAIVVVEGPRDAKALGAIGFNGSLITLYGNRLTKLVAKAEKHSRTILLFDLDQEGRSLTKKAALILEGKKQPIDLFFRRELAHATKGHVRHVEELARFKEYLTLIPVGL